MIVEAADPKEYSEVYDVVDKAFIQSKLESTIIRVTTCEDPVFQEGDLRVAKADGKIVSMMMLIRRQLRIGAASVNGAIVAPVATHPDYQKKGYCSEVMRNAIRYMRIQGFDITILWGNPWLYPRYGYSPAMMKTEIVIKPEHIVSVENKSCEFRRFSEIDLEQMARLYHSNTVTRACSEIRSPTMWEWKPGGTEVKLEVLSSKEHEVIGYLALGTDWGRPCIHEIGVLNDEACKVIYRHILEIMKAKGLKEFYCIVHPDHPFARFAFWRGGEIRIRSGGGAGMARVLNLASFLTKMEKEFEYRLRHSEFHNRECTLKISSEEATVFLDNNRGRVTVSIENSESDYQLDIPISYLNPLVTGYRDIRELANKSDVKVNGGESAVRLLEILFPVGYPSGGFLPLVWE